MLEEPGVARLPCRLLCGHTTGPSRQAEHPGEEFHGRPHADGRAEVPQPLPVADDEPVRRRGDPERYVVGSLGAHVECEARPWTGISWPVHVQVELKVPAQQPETPCRDVVAIRRAVPDRAVALRGWYERRTGTAWR